MLPPRGTFPISNLIPGPRLGFLKDMLFPKLWSHFLGFFFLVLFSLQNKNKIGGDSNFFSKINFSQIKKRVSPIEWGCTWKMRVHNESSECHNWELTSLNVHFKKATLNVVTEKRWSLWMLSCKEMVALNTKLKMWLWMSNGKRHDGFECLTKDKRRLWMPNWRCDSER